MSRGLVLFSILFTGCAGPQRTVQAALDAGRGVVHLPPGVIEIHSELKIPAGAHDLEIAGAPTTVLRAAEDFRGRALITCSNAARVRLHGFTIDGNKTFREARDMAPPENAFRLMYVNNGLWFDQTGGIAISDMTFRNIAAFAVLISRSRDIQIERSTVAYCGSLNQKFRNNTTGGIVIEEASSNFAVRQCRFLHIPGNGLWTHSLLTSQPNRDGLFEDNEFDTIGRDALQVGAAENVRVLRNHGRRIGFPENIVDLENEGTPVAIDTAGDVSRAEYAGNRFEEVDGKCFDLDGFHDGQVRDNSCINPGNAAAAYKFGHYAVVMNDSNPNMHSRNVVISGNQFNGIKFGGIYIVGGPHRIENNRFLNLNLAHCNDNPAIGCVYLKDQPDLLRSGIYLAGGVHKQDPTAGNIIRGNTVEGYKIRDHCIVAGPAVSLSANTIDANACHNEP